MAGEASQVAGGLRRTPVIDGQEEATEKAAADALEAAEQALRDAADQLSPRNEAAEPEPVTKDIGESREQLESARDRLQQAMAGETGSRQSQMQQAASRQQGLQQEAQQLRGDMNSGDDADLSPEQRDAADKPIRQAEDLMQQARQSLQKGRQSTAAEQQAQAAKALERAAEAMERERPLTADQNQALRDLAEKQEQLEEDIIRLAREVEERKNERAKQALDDATEAAAKAAEAMQDGDNQETDQQQQEARDRLQEAKEALEEERDRYQDLRLEELLFRMQEELVAFLEKQQPITQATREAQESLGDNTRMTRRVRRKLNDLARQETELVSKAEYLRTALEEEGTLVFSHALKTNEEDLGEVSRRLGSRYPDPGELTVMLQEEVEERTTKLIEALKREQERRRNEDQGGGENEESGEQGQNQASRPRLVPILAELQMLRQMEQDMMERTEHMTTLVGSRGADGITDLETALMERMANRHHAVTRIFLQLKAQLEQAMQQPDDGTSEEEKKPNKDEDK